MEADRRKFTVMEIFIVLVVLGIIGAVTVPRFSQAYADGKLGHMVSNLQMVRSQIQLYKIQHGDLLPGQEVRHEDVARRAQGLRPGYPHHDGELGSARRGCSQPEST